MAVTEITTAPPLISATAKQYFTSTNLFVGAYEVGGSLYCVLSSITGGVTIHVYKSTDGGSTWTAQDDGNAQEFFVAGQQSVFQPDTVTLFFTNIGFSNASDAYAFDIPSDTYGTLTAVNETPGGAQSGCFAQLRSDGSMVYLTFQAQVPVPGSGIVTLGRIYTPGSFSARFIVDSETGGGAQFVVARELVVDSSDDTHVLTFYSNDTNTVQELRYLTIDSGDVVSSPVVLDSTADIQEQYDPPVADTGQLGFPFRVPVGGFSRVKLRYATGATSNPGTASWSVIDVWTSGLDASSIDEVSFAILDTNGDILVFWINAPPAGSFKVYYARFNGVSFDAPVVFYDPLLYPPAGATQDPTFNVAALSIAIIGGQFVGIMAMDIDGTGDQTFYLSNGGAVAGYFHSMY